MTVTHDKGLNTFLVENVERAFILQGIRQKEVFHRVASPDDQTDGEDMISIPPRHARRASDLAAVPHKTFGRGGVHHW